MSSQELATEIVKKLTDAGHIAYFAGGWVRDYLMGHPSEDIDIATDAPPEKILALFPNTILVGLAFGVIIVVIEGHQFEVATFRRDINYVDGRKPSQIELSSPREDAIRRDFTINGMFYDPLKEVVHDFVQGAEDLKERLVRCIGDPYERFVEDRLRMIRAVRFAARFGFTIDIDTQAAIKANAYTLFPAVAMERVWQEFCKMSKYPRFESAVIDMHHLELLQTIFPQLASVHLHDIRKRVAHFNAYPLNMETILFLMDLFPEAKEGEGKELCQYLRTSGADAHLAEYLIHLRKMVKKEEEQGIVDIVEWVHLYANPHAKICLQIIGEKLNTEDFLAKHKRRIKSLQKHIDRLVQKKPLVTAAMLMTQGIVPGKRMGALLKEAECITIKEDLDNAELVITELKKLPLWNSPA